MYHSLQILRALAALAVVFYHVGIAFSSEKYFAIEWMGRWFAAGKYGVELFFVLSGYVICVAHDKDIGRPGQVFNYVKKRFIRVYPTFWVVFLTVWGLTLATRLQIGMLPQDPLVILKALMLVSQDPVVAGATGAPVIIVAWSLHYEVLFYLLYMLLILGWRCSGFALAGGALLMAALEGSRSFTAVGTFLTDKYTHLFFFGIAAGMLRTRITMTCTVEVARRILVLALGLIGLGVVVLAHGGQVAERLQTYLVGVLSVALLLSSVRLEDAGVNFSRSYLARQVGNASYSLYLVHYPLISVACKILQTVAGSWMSNPLSGTVAALVVVMLCVISALAFHQWVERPLIALFSGLILRPRIVHA